MEYLKDIFKNQINALFKTRLKILSFTQQDEKIH